MKRPDTITAGRKASKVLLALAGLSLIAGCMTTKTDKDEGQTKDRPTGGSS